MAVTQDLSKDVIENNGGSSTLSSSPSMKEGKTVDISETMTPTAAIGDTTTFASAGLEDYYAPIGTYEGLHRYDPKFDWEPEEERRLVRKIDYRICTWVCLAFFALQLDRSNITQALSDNMLEDLDVNTNDYNLGQTLFFLAFLLAELPSQLISKRIGPDVWIPIQMVCWSLIASFQAFLTGRTSFLVTRFLLGTFEGGFIPDNILYLSYYYTSVELPKRLAWFWTSYQATSIVSAFMAYGILHMRGINDMAGWRWLFALEGTLTGIIGVVTFFYLPPSPTQTKGWLRGKEGWFNEREEKIMVNRIIRDDPSKGDMHNRQGLTFKMLWETLTDYHMWPVFLIGLTLLAYVPHDKLFDPPTRGCRLRHVPNQLAHHSSLRALHHSGAVLGATIRKSEFTLPRLPRKSVLVISLVIALEFISPNASPWSKWALCSLLVGFPYIHPILVAITSRNGGSVRTRTVASALYNMCVQASQIIGQNVYREDDAPLYRRGNKVLICFCVYNMAITIGAKLFYMRTNKKRDQVWQAMSQDEREHYLANTTDKGNKRLDFRFAH